MFFLFVSILDFNHSGRYVVEFHFINFLFPKMLRTFHILISVSSLVRCLLPIFNWVVCFLIVELCVCVCVCVLEGGEGREGDRENLKQVLCPMEPNKGLDLITLKS